MNMTGFGTVAIIVAAVVSTASAQTLVTYQGVLEDAGQPANGVYDITIEAYDDEFAGDQVDAQTFEDVTVSDGRFSVELDYLADITGPARDIWLEMYVRPGASTGLPTVLVPRQRVTAAPEAGYADRAGSVDLVFSSDILDEPGVAAFVGPDAGDGDLFSSYSVLAQQTITCPASGYVLAIGLTSISTGAFSGSSGSVDVALSLDGATPYEGRTWSHALATTGTGFIGATWPGIAMHMIPVAAGDTTVSLIARSLSGEDYEDSPSLTLVYIPTAYGPVEVQPLNAPPPQWETVEARIERLERLVEVQQAEIERLRRANVPGSGDQSP